MLIISHRANLDGPDPLRENNPLYINEVQDMGFDVEIDVWGDRLMLGHDEPTYHYPIAKFNLRHIWAHAKDLRAASQLILSPYINSFSHDIENAVYTSHGWLWVHPKAILEMPRGNKLYKTIAVLPELYNVDAVVLKNFSGICTDFPLKYRELLGV